jgi:hypothetical protein
MVLTKLTVTSAEMDFPSFSEFMNYCYYVLGHDKFMEIAYLFSDAVIAGVMFPYEKIYWDNNGKGGFLQRYHESSLESKNFQLALTKCSSFIELQHLLGEFHISLSLEMLPSDELDLTNGNLEFIDIRNPGTLLRPGIHIGS